MLAGSSGGTSTLDSLFDLRTETNLELDGVAAAADNDRERAVVAELEQRWDRYVAQSQLVAVALSDGEIAEAERLTRGPANDAFNGFNAVAEANLLDNRDQFEAEVAVAVDGVRWLRWAIAVATVVAALAAWLGYSLRIAEYR